jgi:hypothetical protein
MVARDTLEKRRRAQEREGLPLEASPSTEEEEEEDDDNDNVGMEVCSGFSPKVGPRSAPASVGPYGDVAPSALGPTTSLSRARASTKPAPVPASVEEAEVVEGEAAPLPVEAVIAPAGAPTESPQRPTTGGTWRGPSLPPCSCPGARNSPGHHSALDPCVEGCRRGDHCPAYIGGGAARARNLEAKAFSITYLRVCSQSVRMSFCAPKFPLTAVSIFSSKRRANPPIFTATKTLKRGAGTSAGASSCPLLSRSHLSRVLRWLYPLSRRRLSPTWLRPRWLPRVPRRRWRPSSSPPRMRWRLKHMSCRPQSPTSCAPSQIHPKLRRAWGWDAPRGPAPRGSHVG